MTVSTTTTTITYSGNGSTTVFTFPFIGAAASDISVTYTNSFGISVVLSPSLYTLTMNPIPTGGLWAIGGSVTYPLIGSPLSVGTSISITRLVPFTQTVSIGDQSNFYPQAVEQGLDLIVMELQQSETATKYSLQVPVTDASPPNVLPSAALRANGFLTFDINGQPIITAGPTAAVPAAQANPRKISTTGTATINILTSDSFSGVSVYQSTAPVTTLQLPTTGGPYPIFDGSENAGSFNVTVLPPAGKTIQGASSYVLTTNGQSVTVYWDGTQYVIASGAIGLGTNISVSGSIAAGTTLSAGTSVTATTSISSGTTVTAGTTVSDSKGEIRGIPRNNVITGYTLLATDHGKLVFMGAPGGGVTIPNSVFSTANNVVLYNNTGSAITLTQGSGLTLTFAGNAMTGNRILANTGLATLYFLDGSDCLISGVGLT